GGQGHPHRRRSRHCSAVSRGATDRRDAPRASADLHGCGRESVARARHECTRVRVRGAGGGGAGGAPVRAAKGEAFGTFASLRAAGCILSANETSLVGVVVLSKISYRRFDRDRTRPTHRESSAASLARLPGSATLRRRTRAAGGDAA